MARKYWCLLLIVAASAFARVGQDVRADEPGPGQAKPKAEVECQILIVPKFADGKFTFGPACLAGTEDYIATHQAILKSPKIIEQTLKSPAVGELKSFPQKGDDRAFAIRDAISVSRADPIGNVLAVTLRIDDANEGRLLLESLIQTFQTFLDNTAKYEWDRSLEAKAKVGNYLSEKGEVLKGNYVAHLQKTLATTRTAGDIQTALNAISARKAALLVAQSELQARLDWIEKYRKDPSTKALVVMRASDWANKAGIDKMPDEVRKVEPIQLYLTHLKQSLEENAALAKDLARLEQAERADQQKHVVYELESQKLRDEMESVKGMRADAVKRIVEQSLPGNQGGYDVKPISPPRQKK